MISNLKSGKWYKQYCNQNNKNIIVKRLLLSLYYSEII